MTTKTAASRLAIVLVAAIPLAGCEGGHLSVPQKPFSGYSDAVSVRSTLKGIETLDAEACPWIGDHILLVLSTDAYVDSSGPTLVSDSRQIAIGDVFETAPLVPMPEGFDCGGKRWPRAVQLPSAPRPIS